ncbi:hypothetical protein BpHYR1_010793 [Brachionus plicatilis]|uniref:Uncharacterized protein n=1 Tax=Brachionus plicatilis TaxID=10195 RepID=A0A3M7QVF0_BRAPC|nr:hypothetical protein BpHYR1_010793 [Brachionus plicatilis]
MALLVIASALGPWPWPNEIADNFLENFISSANLYKSAAGSVPWDRTKMSGVEGEESLNTKCNSAVCGSMNRCPMFSDTKSCMAFVTRSGLKHFRKSNFEFHGSGSGSLWGSDESNIFLWFLKSSTNVSNEASDSSVKISPHARSDIQSGDGLEMFFGLLVPPAKKNRYSSINIFLSFIIIRTVSKKANNNLCFSNKLRQTLVYKLNVKCSFMLVILSLRVSAFPAF